MAYDRDRYDRDRYERDRSERDRQERDRGAFERAGDEVRSWFGDEEARRRRERDERYPERGYSAERQYGERDYGRTGRDDRYSTEAPRTEGFRDYSDRYGRSYSSTIDRERTTPSSVGASTSLSARSQEFGREGYGSSGYYGREWQATESWRVPGPYTGRGPKGYQRSDERIREDVSDRLTAHGHLDASDIEVRIQSGEVTLIGFVDNRSAKRAAEDIAEEVPGVREVHNQLRVRTNADDTGVGRTSVLGLTERETQTAETARQADAATRSRARNP